MIKKSPARQPLQIMIAFTRNSNPNEPDSGHTLQSAFLCK